MGAQHLSGGLAVLVCDSCGARSRPVRPFDTEGGRIIRLQGWVRAAGERGGTVLVCCPECAGTDEPRPAVPRPRRWWTRP